MQQVSKCPAAGGKHRGNTFILVIVIVLFAVGAAMFFKSSTQGPAGPVQECPWVEIDRLVDDISSVNLPESPQRNLGEEINFTVSIKNEEGEKRGRLEITIDPDGLAGAYWNAKYKEGKLEKEFTSSSAGNVDASMLYEDENGTDDSQLFFMTEGTFLLQAFTQGNARAGGGEAYVVGWLDDDGSAHGTLVLAPDRKSTTIYEWEKPAPQ